MYDHAGRRVDDKKRPVLENNLQRHGLRSHLGIDLQAGFDLNPLPADHPVFRPEAAAVHLPLPSDVDWPTDLGQDLYHVADLRVWLDGLRDDLGRILPEPVPSGEAAGLRDRVAHLADGAAGS